MKCLTSSRIYRKRHLVGKNYFAVENIEVIAEGNGLTVVELDN